jgi:hypothetical protein
VWPPVLVLWDVPDVVVLGDRTSVCLLGAVDDDDLDRLVGLCPNALDGRSEAVVPKVGRDDY